MSVAPIQRAPGLLGTTLVSSESQRDTYSIAIAPSAVAATPTDIFTLQGSSSRIVVMKRLFVNSSGNTNGLLPFYQHPFASTIPTHQQQLR